MATTTKAKVLELQRLFLSGGKNIFRRCQLASECFEDADFIDTEWGGKEDAARASFENLYFSDVAGFVTIDRLISIYRAYPNESTWESHHYRLPDMLAMFLEEHPPEAKQTHERPAWKARAREAEEQLGNVEAQLSAKDRKIAELTAANEELTRKVYRLEAKLETLTATECAA